MDEQQDLVSQEDAAAALVVEYFLSSLDVGKETKERYRLTFGHFIEWTKETGNQPASMSAQDYMEYRDYLLRDHKPSTVRAYLVPVRAFYRWAASKGICQNITDGVKSPKQARGFKKDNLTSEQAKDVLRETQNEDGLRGMRDFALVNLLMRVGLRVREAALANVEDLNTLGDKRVLWIQGKGRAEKDEFVVLTPETARPIDLYLSERKVESGKEPLFASVANRNKGGRMTTRSISRICKEAMRAAGYDSERLTAHSLRHTAITAALLGGASVQEAQAMARHASMETTLVYSHNIDRLENPAEEAVTKFFED